MLVVIFPSHPFCFRQMPKSAGGVCGRAGIFLGSHKCDIIPPQSLHYGAANNTPDKAGRALRASLQVIITFGQIAFCVTARCRREGPGRGLAGPFCQNREGGLAARQPGFAGEGGPAGGGGRSCPTRPRAGCAGPRVFHLSEEGLKIPGVLVCRGHWESCSLASFGAKMWVSLSGKRTTTAIFEGGSSPPSPALSLLSRVNSRTRLKAVLSFQSARPRAKFQVCRL